MRVNMTNWPGTSRLRYHSEGAKGFLGFRRWIEVDPSLINPVSGVYPRGMHMQAEVLRRKEGLDRREMIEESPDYDILRRLSDIDRLLPDPGNRSTLIQR